MLLHHINPDSETEGSIAWTALPAGWYILNVRDSGDHHTVVGPFESQEAVMIYCDDTTSLFDTERIIKVV